MSKHTIAYIEKNFGLWLLIMGVIGYVFPEGFLWGGNISDKLLMFSFFLGCLRIDLKEALHLKSNYRKLFLFAFLNMILLPVLLFFATSFLELDTRSGLFLIMATSGGMLTPLISSFMGLNVLWAVVYVILTSSLVPFTLPLLVDLLFGIKMDVSGLDMILFLSKIVFPPAILAFLIRRYMSNFSKKLMVYSGSIGSFNMAFFIGIVIAQNHRFLQANLFQMSTLPILGIMCLIFIVRYVIGFNMPYNNKNERWSNALLFGVMNNGLVILFASQYFSEQVLFVTILSEIPWILAQPIFQRVKQARG